MRSLSKRRRSSMMLCIVLTMLQMPHVSFAGETLTGLYRSPHQKAAAIYRSATKTQEYLSLPFLDDFSHSLQGTPQSQYWQPSQALVNSGYLKNAPTCYGVTFDALNEVGELYPQASYDPFGADTLCSRPFALAAYHAADSVSLMFQFQAGGYGAFPSETDSICLEFFDPLAMSWNTVWSAKAYQNGQTPQRIEQIFWYSNLKKYTYASAADSIQARFVPVLITLPSQYLQDGFSFRWRNVASLSRLDAVPGLSSNTDHWNLSLVYMNTRTAGDPVFFKDVLMQGRSVSALREYTAMPWRHFKGNSAAQLLLMDQDRIKSMTMHYRSAAFRPVQVGRFFRIQETAHPANVYQTETLWDRLETGDTMSYTYRGYDFNFASSESDSAAFRISSVLTYTGAAYPYTANDSLSFVQSFKDYYAYDDGQAENGYGLFGRWAGGSMVALKFTNQLAQQDTLKGVYVFFNRSLENSNRISFKLAVWSEFNSYPGAVLYDTTAIEPALEYGKGGWEYFRFEKPLVVRGNFYVGWQQVGENMLNVGFDANATVNGKHFVNEGDGWILSAYNGKGIPMIRPAFGSFRSTVTASPELNLRLRWCLYPNPCTDYLYIKSSDLQSSPYRIQVLSTDGRKLKDIEGSPSSVYLGDLPKGIYLIRLLSGTQSEAQTIVIQ